MIDTMDVLVDGEIRFIDGVPWYKTSGSLVDTDAEKFMREEVDLALKLDCAFSIGYDPEKKTYIALWCLE
jgi:hypothetical protein